MTPRLLLDVTRTVDSGLHTGIQRVVRGLWQGARAAGLPVLAVRCDSQYFVQLSHLPPHSLEGLAPQPAADTLPFQPRSGDILLMADASWYLEPPPWPAVDRLLAAGVELAGFVHDLLPLEQSQWFRPGLKARFASHFDALLARASHLFAPSEAVVDALLPRCAARGRHIPVTSLPLASNLQNLAPVELPLALRSASIGAADYFLVVASIEPRKNHPLIVDVFEQRWATGDQTALVLVGHAGWCMDDFVARLQHHPERQRRLHWLQDINDPQLASLYRHARATLCLSQAEGFGLPLLEARQLGCPVIASDLPVLRASGGDWAHYLPLDPDLARLRHKLATALEEIGDRTQCPPSVIRDWPQCAKELMNAVKQSATDPS
ncbi:MAG: glycosyltransferase family 1 protein [Thauera sp.]|nr:glycosyltransferase family 1 protein [Thauera sp.]